MPNIFSIQKYECLFRIKSTSNDILGIFNSPSLIFLNCGISLVEEFFIISYLDDKWDIESILKVFSEHKWHQVSKMHLILRRTSTSIKVEWLPLFVEVQNNVKISVREENITFQEWMSWLSSQPFNLLYQILVDLLGSKISQ